MENTNQVEKEIDKNEAEATETPVSETPEVNELKKLQDELAESKDKYLRLYSEFENFRRRTAKEKLDLIQGANENLLKNLLPVLDDFERAENSFKELNTKEAEGFLLIYTKYKKVMEQAGVKVMDLKSGDTFDADRQEAITQIPATDEKLKGKVVDVVEKGYVLNDKVVRFAKVIVGS